MQSLNPTVPRPPIRAIWLHGPQNAQFTNRTAPVWVAVTSTMVGSGPWNDTNSPLVISSANGALCSTTIDVWQSSAPMPRKLPLHTPGLALHEAVAGVIAEAEGVEHVLPVGPAEDERVAVLHLPAEQLRLHAPPRVEMDVLDPADVVDRVDPDAGLQGLALHVADQVPLVAGGVDAVVGVEQLDVEHGRVLAAHRDGPGVGLGHVVDVLVRVVDHHAPERAVGVEREEGGGVFLAGVCGDEERCAVVGRLRHAAVAHAGVRGHRGPDALERHRRGDVQAAREEVVAARRVHDAAARLAGGVEGLLEGRGVVGLAVAQGAMVADVLITSEAGPAAIDVAAEVMQARRMV